MRAYKKWLLQSAKEMEGNLVDNIAKIMVLDLLNQNSNTFDLVFEHKNKMLYDKTPLLDLTTKVALKIVKNEC
jgi:hypothetical protein